LSNAEKKKYQEYFDKSKEAKTIKQEWDALKKQKHAISAEVTQASSIVIRKQEYAKDMSNALLHLLKNYVPVMRALI